jgi:tRNA uridine 5-carbamoylmethylation protein Kti12
VSEQILAAQHESSEVATPGPIIVVSGPAGVGKSTVSRLIAAAFNRSVHLQTDDLLASVVNGWVDPALPEAERQNEAIGAALAVAAMSFAQDGYTTIVDGYLFPDGVAGLADACRGRHLSCHYVVLAADAETCWTRASDRPEGRWPLEPGPVAQVYARFANCGVDETHVVEATANEDEVASIVLAALRDGTLAVAEPPRNSN